MRFAIISDIHGNLEALDQVLADIDSRHIDKIIDLGDNIGYGPDPEQVMDQILDRKIPSILGNHELALMEPELLDWFNPAARESLLKTRKMLSAHSLAFIETMEKSMVMHNCRFVHGFPPDSVTTYLFEVDQLRLEHAFSISMDQLCFTGHTHRLEAVGSDGDKIFRHPLHRGIFQIDPSKKYIFNVGSVGQPRDGDNRAKYVILDDTARTLEARFVPYDIVITAKKIIAAGLPRMHADRLW